MYPNYRFDRRSKTQFKKDIKTSHLKEADIAVRIGILEYQKTKEWPIIQANGCDFTGSFIAKSSDINIDPDFIIGEIPTEITRSDFLCKEKFHEKVNKVINCIKNKVDLVFVNGIVQNKCPEFVVIKPNQLEKLTDKSIKTYGEISHFATGSKMCYRYDIGWITNWQILPSLKGIKLPEEYKKILNLEA